jgi:hypothetical protein
VFYYTLLGEYQKNIEINDGPSIYIKKIMVMDFVVIKRLSIKYSLLNRYYEKSGSMLRERNNYLQTRGKPMI